jgi:hypothetical protein
MSTPIVIHTDPNGKVTRFYHKGEYRAFFLARREACRNIEEKRMRDMVLDWDGANILEKFSLMLFGLKPTRDEIKRANDYWDTHPFRS